MGNRHISKLKNADNIVHNKSNNSSNNSIKIDGLKNKSNSNENVKIMTTAESTSKCGSNTSVKSFTDTNISFEEIVDNQLNCTSNSKNTSEVKLYLTNEKNNKKYKLIKLIGKGFYSNVYLADGFVSATKKTAQFAFKIIKKKNIIKNNYFNFIFNEKNILNKLNNKSPFIIELIETFQNEKNIVMVFPYYNIDLFYFNKNFKEAKNENVIKLILAQICLTISFLHENNILYRDLKPENFVINSENGYIKLIDFGLAVENVTEDSEIEGICGTNQYIPPEVVLGEKYNFNYDWWGYGILMYELFYGRPPFIGKDNNDIFLKIVNEKIEFNENNTFPVSDDAKDLISYLLNKNKDYRIKPEQIIYHPFFSDINFDLVKTLDFKFSIPVKTKGSVMEYIIGNITDLDNTPKNKRMKEEISIDQDKFKDF